MIRCEYSFHHLRSFITHTYLILVGVSGKYDSHTSNSEAHVLDVLMEQIAI